MATNLTTARSVAAEVRAHLARRGQSRGDLATALGMSVSAVTRRVSGDLPFDIQELAATADFLGVPLTTLLPDESAA